MIHDLTPLLVVVEWGGGISLSDSFLIFRESRLSLRHEICRPFQTIHWKHCCEVLSFLPEQRRLQGRFYGSAFRLTFSVF